MKTSSFYLYSGAGRVSIARSAPRCVAAGFRIYKKLAPGPWLFDPAYQDQKKYRERYFSEILGPLDPQSTWNALHELAGTYEPVLLCHEHYPTKKADQWCHRRMVAEWFMTTLGHAVSELDIEGSVKKQADLFGLGT